MAVKLDSQYFKDEEGQLLLGDTSWVTCSDEDPYRIRGTEGQGIVVTEKNPSGEKGQR